MAPLRIAGFLLFSLIVTVLACQEQPTAPPAKSMLEDNSPITSSELSINAQINQLLALIDQVVATGDLSAGPANGLSGQLNAAVMAFNEGRIDGTKSIRGTIGLLSGFIDMVEHFRDNGQISNEGAAALIGSAEEILGLFPPATLIVTILVDGVPFAGTVPVYLQGPTSTSREVTGSTTFAPVISGGYRVYLGNVNGYDCDPRHEVTYLAPGEFEIIEFNCSFVGGLLGIYEVLYVPIASTCDFDSSLPPFFVGGVFIEDFLLRSGNEEEYSLSVQFPDAPVPIVGPFFPATLGFDGTTGPIDLGQGLTVEEYWSFVFDFATYSFVGSSHVPFTETSTGDPVCTRDFDISGKRVSDP